MLGQYEPVKAREPRYSQSSVGTIHGSMGQSWSVVTWGGFLIVGLLSILVIMTGVSAEGAENVTMHPDIIPANGVSNGDVVTISVEVRNPTSKGLSGVLRMELQDNPVVTRSISIPSYSSNTHHLSAPVHFENYQARTLLVQLSIGGRIVMNSHSQLFTLNSDTKDTRVFIIDRMGGSISGLDGSIVKSAGRYTDSEIATTSLSASLMPDSVHGYSAAHTVVIYRPPTTYLTQDQKDALGAYVMQGGKLILFTGIDHEKVEENFAPFLPGDATGLELQVPSVIRMTSNESMSSFTTFQNEMANVDHAIARYDLGHGWSSILEANGSSYLATRDYGKGRIMLYTFSIGDLTDSNFSLYDKRVIVTESVKYIVGSGYDPVDDRNVLTMPWEQGGRNYIRSNILVGSLPEIYTPPVSIPTVILLIYFVAVGPGTFYYLKGRSREEAYIYILPLVVLIFSILIIAGISMVRDVDTVLHQVGVVQFDEGASSGLVTTYGYLYSGDNFHTSLSWHSPTMVHSVMESPMYEESYGYYSDDTVMRPRTSWSDQPRLHATGLDSIKVSGSKIVLDSILVQADATYFSTSTFVDASMGLEGHIEGDELVLTNSGERRLEDVILMYISPGVSTMKANHRLDDISSGKTVRLSISDITDSGTTILLRPDISNAIDEYEQSLLMAEIYDGMDDIGRLEEGSTVYVIFRFAHGVERDNIAGEPGTDPDVSESYYIGCVRLELEGVP